jgi:hypothetical protein
MAEPRNEDKPIKKDQQGVRDAQQEVEQEIRSSGTKPRINQPNRDRARGDWDRSGVHHDEGTSRAPAEQDEPFDERS